MKSFSLRRRFCSGFLIVIGVLAILVISLGIYCNYLQKTLYCQKISNGMTIEEIENELTRIGEHKVVFDNDVIRDTYRVRFTGPIIEDLYGPTTYFFMKNGKLVAVGRMVSVSDMSPYCEY